MDRIAAICNVQVDEPAGQGPDRSRKAGRTGSPAGQARDVHEPERAFGRGPARRIRSRIEDLIVIYDELAFPLGTVRLAERGSANGHNGVKSVSVALGTEEWMRVRIGVGKAPTETGREIKRAAPNICSSPMRKADLRCWKMASTSPYAPSRRWLTAGPSAAMNEFNRKEIASRRSPSHNSQTDLNSPRQCGQNPQKEVIE